MTLRELVIHYCGNADSVSIVSCLADLTVENIDKFCPSLVRDYLLSEGFQWDQHTCESDYHDAVSKLLKPFLEINRSEKDNNFFISLKGTPLEE